LGWFKEAKGPPSALDLPGRRSAGPGSAGEEVAAPTGVAAASWRLAEMRRATGGDDGGRGSSWFERREKGRNSPRMRGGIVHFAVAVATAAGAGTWLSPSPFLR
jgi:hypothetical protein